jgi:hypothetical protein
MLFIVKKILLSAHLWFEGSAKGQGVGGAVWT